MDRGIFHRGRLGQESAHIFVLAEYAIRPEGRRIMLSLRPAKNTLAEYAIRPEGRRIMLRTHKYN